MKKKNYVVDDNKPHLGGNIAAGDPCTWCPSAWQYIIDTFKIKSVTDVGSGRGWAAKWFAEKGLQTTAIEGLKENVETAVYPTELIDLTESAFSKSVDLVNCIEVVEHIEEKYIENLLTTLTQGQYLLMTHAVPGQKGWHHVNCQPSEYWIEKLNNKGFFLLESHSETVRKLAAQDGGIHIARNGMLFKKK